MADEKIQLNFSGKYTAGDAFKEGNADVKAVMRTINNTRSAENIKALEAKREAERKRKPRNR